MKEITPANKFHMMELSHGWVPLCRVLKLPLPDEPFPRANDADAVKNLELQILLEAGIKWVAILGTFVLLVICIKIYTSYQ